MQVYHNFLRAAYRSNQKCLTSGHAARDVLINVQPNDLNEALFKNKFSGALFLSLHDISFFSRTLR